MKTYNPLYALFVYTIITIIHTGCGHTTCTNEENLGYNAPCFAATILDQGNPYPIPVNHGGVVKLRMKIAAINDKFVPINATITTKIISSSNGQLIGTYSGTVLSNSSFQDVPIWSNVNVASGIYILEVKIDVGVCGTKTICLTDNRRIFVNN